MHNFVVFSLSPWNIEFGANIKDISTELARTHNVLYVDVPLKRKERWFKNTPAIREVKQRIRQKQNLISISPRLWHYVADEMLESVNSISNPVLFDLVNKINNRRFSKAIRKAVKEVGFSDYILINDNDIYNGFYLGKMLEPELYLYYLRDRLPAMAYWKRQTGRLEPDLIRSVDGVVANSQYLADYAQKFNSKSYYVGQGCDVSYFLQRPEKPGGDELRNIARPRAGYIGALNSERLDIPLLFELANRMKDFNFVLVGQEDDGFLQSNLHQLDNVFFTGRKDFSELPALLYEFDVAINPQRVNEITVGNYPRKVDEYLAAGKPVVATRTTAMKPFEEHVYLADQPSDYERLIRQAISDDDEVRRQGRKNFAAGHTWGANVSEIMKAIEVIRHEE